LLLNDKFNENWQVYVDGKEAELLRANFIMRGVQLSPEAKHVEFRFTPPTGPMWISLATMLAVLGVVGFTAVSVRSETKNG
jgi:uncharacterized membrane protein YfhO